MSFITAVSTENSTNPVGSDDISPAQFRVLFDSPIEIENIDLELVSCKVSKLNRINVITNQNTIIFRLGDASDQYRATIKPGNYTPLELATEIKDAMNAVVPTNNYKGFSSSLTGSAGSTIIQLTYTRQNVPTTATFVENRKNLFSEGPEFAITDTSHNDTTGFVTYEYPDGQLTNNRSVFKRPNDTFEFCGPMDVGQQLTDFRGIDDSTRTAFAEYGIWEESKGSEHGDFECIVKPLMCCINSNFERGYGGLHLDFAGNSYFTFEIEPVLDEDGNELPVDNPEHFGSLFPNVLLKKNIPRQVKNKNERVINGVMNKVISDAFPNDLRKEPYNASKEFIFPTSVDGSTKRTLKYETNWSGQLVMKQGVGRPSKNAPFPIDYTFKMDDSSGSRPRKKARSKVKKFGLQTERIRIRPSINTLMQGLFQQTGIDSNTVNDTDCILGYTSGGGSSHIHYIAGTEGRVNYREDNNVLQNNTQNLVPNSGDSFVHTYYKIIAVDSTTGQPTQVKLTDGGEHVIAFDSTNFANTVMFLNDPATYKVVSTGFSVADLNNMKNEFHYLDVSSTHISQAVSNGAITTDFASRFPSFNAGLMADNIFHNNFVGSLDSNLVLNDNNVDSFVDSIRERNPLFVPKNYEIDIGSKITSSTTDLNNNGLLVNIYQYQPNSPDEEFSKQLNRKLDVKKLVFKGNSNTWNTLGITANWTNFDPLSSTAAVRIRFQTEDTYTYSILLAYNTDFALNPTNFLEEQLLTRTGIARTGFPKNEALLKIRDFPLHPIFSSGTGTNKETGVNKCVTLVKSRGSKYEYEGGSNFERNLNNRVIETEPPTPDLTAYNVPQISNVGGTLPVGAKPLIMVKTFPLDTNQIKTTPPITSDAIEVVKPQDFTPNASLMTSGMHSVMYKQMAVGDDTMNFQTHQSTTNTTYLPTFAVEVNLPIQSHIGKNFTKGQVDNPVGSGIKSKIVGVCPGNKFEDQQGPIADYTYQMNYSKPVSIRLPYKASFYSMDFTLRSILDGKILKDLVHSTEVVLRMYNIIK